MSTDTASNETVYREGPAGLPYSRAETLSGQVYESTRHSAAVDGHAEDASLVAAEMGQFTKLLHSQFTPLEAETLARKLAPHARPVTYVPDEASMQQAQRAVNVSLAKRHGMIGSVHIQEAAQAAISRMTKLAPGLQRLLIENGGAFDPDLVEHLAHIARSKGWS